MKRLLLALAFVLASQTFALAQLDGPSLWKNQRGSELNITSVTGTQFAGTFTNRAAGFSCLGIPYPVTGINAGPYITFTVNFAKCRSVARWQGNVQGLGMSVQWALQYVSNGKPAVMTGFDLFTRYR